MGVLCCERNFCKVSCLTVCEITGWLMATVPWRFDYILSRFLLRRSAHSSVHALDFSTHEKIKKKTNELYRRSARFFDSTLNAFQARRKKLTVRHRLLTGKPLAWLDTVLFSCAHVPPWHSLPLCLRFYSVSKNGTCLSNCTATISCNKLSRNEMKGAIPLISHYAQEIFDFVATVITSMNK